MAAFDCDQRRFCKLLSLPRGHVEHLLNAPNDHQVNGQCCVAFIDIEHLRFAPLSFQRTSIEVQLIYLQDRALRQMQTASAFARQAGLTRDTGRFGNSMHLLVGTALCTCLQMYSRCVLPTMFLQIITAYEVSVCLCDRIGLRFPRVRENGGSNSPHVPAGCDNKESLCSKVY